MSEKYDGTDEYGGLYERITVSTFLDFSDTAGCKVARL